MKRFALAVTLTAGLASPLFAAQTFGPLIDAKTLSADLSTVAPLVLDIRGEAYAGGHIPGAVSAPYPEFRGPKDNPGALVPEDQLEATLRGLGITFDRPVVVVHEGDTDTDFGAAARVYWTLKSSGVTQLAILNGGMTGWQAEKLPLDMAPSQPVPSTIDITFSDKWLADTANVIDVVEGKEDAVLVDARPAEFFNGDKAHEAAKRPGTLPGAENIVHSIWFENGTQIVDAARAKEIAAENGLAPGHEIVSFCNTGHWAATDWFALSELAGLDDVKLYPDSMVAYSKTGKEMANVPGLLKNLLDQVSGN